MAYNDRLRELRKARGLTQTEMAKLIDVKTSTYSGYELGKSEPSMLVFTKLMSVLEIDPDYLFQDEVASFSANRADPDEMEMIKKYRQLDLLGQEAVKSVLEREYKRRQEFLEGQNIVSVVYIQAITGARISDFQPSEVKTSGSLILLDSDGRYSSAHFAFPTSKTFFRHAAKPIPGLEDRILLFDAEDYFIEDGDRVLVENRGRFYVADVLDDLYYPINWHAAPSELDDTEKDYYSRSNDWNTVYGRFVAVLDTERIIRRNLRSL